MNDFVAKPMSADELTAAITRLTQSLPDPLAPLPLTVSELPPELARFAALPGIDFGKGMDTWRDFGEYRRFLQKFADDYADCPAQFTAMLEAGQQEHAAALVHKLKGAAGTLALTGLFQLTREIEACTDSAAALQLVPRLCTTLDAAFASIAQLGTGAAPAATEPDMQQAATLLGALLQALDTDTPDQANALLRQLAPSLPAGALAPVQSCLDNFDFRAAEAQVRQLARALAIHLHE